MTGKVLVFDPRDPSDAVRTYKVRKAHTKSRAGCKNCKLRRVKASEFIAPQCANESREGGWNALSEAILIVVHCLLALTHPTIVRRRPSQVWSLQQAVDGLFL